MPPSPEQVDLGELNGQMDRFSQLVHSAIEAKEFRPDKVIEDLQKSLADMARAACEIAKTDEPEGHIERGMAVIGAVERSLDERLPGDMNYVLSGFLRRVLRVTHEEARSIAEFAKTDSEGCMRIVRDARGTLHDFFPLAFRDKLILYDVALSYPSSAKNASTSERRRLQEYTSDDAKRILRELRSLVKDSSVRNVRDPKAVKKIISTQVQELREGGHLEAVRFYAEGGIDKLLQDLLAMAG